MSVYKLPRSLILGYALAVSSAYAHDDIENPKSGFGTFSANECGKRLDRQDDQVDDHLTQFGLSFVNLDWKQKIEQNLRAIQFRAKELIASHSETEREINGLLAVLETQFRDLKPSQESQIEKILEDFEMEAQKRIAAFQELDREKWNYLEAQRRELSQREEHAAWDKKIEDKISEIESTASHLIAEEKSTETEILRITQNIKSRLKVLAVGQNRAIEHLEAEFKMTTRWRINAAKKNQKNQKNRR